MQPYCIYLCKSRKLQMASTEKVWKYKQIIKQLLNSVLVGYEELLGPWFVLSALAFADNTNLCLYIIPHILRGLNSIIDQ